MVTGLVFHEQYLSHRSGFDYGPFFENERPFDNPETMRRFRNLLKASGLLVHLVPITPRKATIDEVCRFHSAEYVQRIRLASDAGGGDAGEEAPFGPGSYEIALLAAGGVINAVDAVLSGNVTNAYALVRPSGHHAEINRGRGYCIFNNIVLGALHAREMWDVDRLAIVDWDVHHGNGTEQAFSTDESVLTISIHQAGNYPEDTGDIESVSAELDVGQNINIPLPPGSGGGAYIAAFERIIIPSLRAHRPKLILVACGFDAGGLDPLGRMVLSSDIFRKMTQAVMSVAKEVCADRLVFSQEGGYSTYHVPFCGLATLEELSGVRTDVQDPFIWLDALPYQQLQPQQNSIIAEVEGASAPTRSKTSYSATSMSGNL